jgi:hypothetical protein
MSKKIFIGTNVVVATSKEKAQQKFDKACEHIVEEDGNPYNTMLDWKEATDYDICPKCDEPNHKVNGHWCCYYSCFYNSNTGKKMQNNS